MLQKLSIQNYAIIDTLDIQFSGKLNAITGETGAGKSIIAGSLGLILGQRADSSVLVNKEKKCIVEGIFVKPFSKPVLDYIQQNEFDFEEEIVLRREIAVNGKSRAFINDTPVNLTQLHACSRLLVDMHQQFDTLEIGDSDFQREVLDALAGNKKIFEEFRSVYQQWHQSQKELKALLDTKQQFEKEADYNRFQYQELEDAAFKENEIEESELLLKSMTHAEGIKSVLGQVNFELSESEEPIIQTLKSLINQLNTQAAYHPDIPGLVSRLQSTQVELKDIAGDVESLSGEIGFDAAQLEQLNDRVSLGYKLQKKHGLSDTASLLKLQQELSEKLRASLDIEDAIANKEKEVGDHWKKASSLAVKLSAQRKKEIKSFEERVNKLLTQVGMPNARMKVGFDTVELKSDGIDDIDFLFNANIPAGEKENTFSFQPVTKVASGGELSRLMLCIKSLVAESIDLPTLIFDEIDTGISGEAAKQVGIIMQSLAEQRQVICITHQPQIAGKATAHFFVFKENAGKSVRTNIRQLGAEERITAIARMLGGEKPSAAALENAREMVST